MKNQNTGSHALLGKSLALPPSFVNSVRTYEMYHYHFQTGNCTIRSHCDASKVFHRQIHLLPWACQLTNKQMVIHLQISLQTVMLRRSRWVARGIFYSTLERTSFSSSSGRLSFPHILKIARMTSMHWPHLHFELLRFLVYPTTHNLLPGAEWSNQNFVGPGLHTPLVLSLESELKQ